MTATLTLTIHHVATLKAINGKKSGGLPPADIVQMLSTAGVLRLKARCSFLAKQNDGARFKTIDGARFGTIDGARFGTVALKAAIGSQTCSLDALACE
jgi:hypothetical protein